MCKKFSPMDWWSHTATNLIQFCRIINGKTWLLIGFCLHILVCILLWTVYLSYAQKNFSFQFDFCGNSFVDWNGVKIYLEKLHFISLKLRYKCNTLNTGSNSGGNTPDSLRDQRIWEEQQLVETQPSVTFPTTLQWLSFLYSICLMGLEKEPTTWQENLSTEHETCIHCDIHGSKNSIHLTLANVKAFLFQNSCLIHTKYST